MTFGEMYDAVIELNKLDDEIEQEVAGLTRDEGGQVATTPHLASLLGKRDELRARKVTVILPITLR